MHVGTIHAEQDVVFAQADLIRLALVVNFDDVDAATVEFCRDAGEFGAGQFGDFLGPQTLCAGWGFDGDAQVLRLTRADDRKVKRLTDGRGVDVLIDNVGTPLFEPMRRSLGIAGRWILIGQLDGRFVPFNPAQLFLKNQSMLSVTSTSRTQLEDVLALLQRGQVKAVVTRSFALEEAGVAHTLMEAGQVTGRVVLRPNG